jgi:hypothetical protein
VGWAEDGLSSGWIFGASGKFTDRPTITYRPRTGSEFAKNMVEPIPPHGVLFLIQAGYSARLILPPCVDSINGLRAGSGSMDGFRAPDEGYTRLVESLFRAQQLGVLGMRVEEGTDKRRSTVVFFHQRDLTPEEKETLDEIRSLLRLDPERNSFKVGYSTGPGGGDSIVMLTRSVLAILFQLATQIDVPPEDEKKGYTIPARPGGVRLIRVQTGRPPDDAFVKARYQDDWFWIANSDLLSKRAFAFVTLLSNFAETSRAPAPTLVTVQG